jgi:hypothetical protein
MYRHIRGACKIKNKKSNDTEDIYQNISELQTNMEALFEKKIAEMKKEMEEKMEKKMKEEMEKRLKQINHNTKINGNNNNVNNGTINNIVIVGHGKEDMSKIDSADILKVLKNGYNSTIHLTETVHFNPKYPEFQNIYISNIKDKYAMMYNGEKWILITKEELIEKIYNNKRNYIEENLEKYIESLPKIHVKSLNRWLDTDESDPRITKIKNDIKILLYNSRNLPMDSLKDKIKPDMLITDTSENTNNQTIKKTSKKQNIKKIIITDE